MKCSLCNHYHVPGMPCIDDAPFNQSFSALPRNNFLNDDPIISHYEPPNFDLFPNPDPIIPRYEPPKIDLFPNPEPIFPSYEPPSYNRFINPDPIIPTYQRPEPLIPPPAPVYNIDHSVIGWKPALENKIDLGFGTRLEINPGGFVRDPLGNLVGEMGPGNTIHPPSLPRIPEYYTPPTPDYFNPPPPPPLMPNYGITSLPQMPDYGPPQSTPEVWDPGYSPMKPFG